MKYDVKVARKINRNHATVNMLHVLVRPGDGCKAQCATAGLELLDDDTPATGVNGKDDCGLRNAAVLLGTFQYIVV
jgi:hypothetical protein